MKLEEFNTPQERVLQSKMKIASDFGDPINYLLNVRMDDWDKATCYAILFELGMIMHQWINNFTAEDDPFREWIMKIIRDCDGLPDEIVLSDLYSPNSKLASFMLGRPNEDDTQWREAKTAERNEYRAYWDKVHEKQERNHVTQLRDTIRDFFNDEVDDLALNHTGILLKGTLAALKELVEPIEPIDHTLRSELEKLAEMAEAA